MYNLFEGALDILMGKDRFLFGHHIVVEDVTCAAE